MVRFGMTPWHGLTYPSYDEIEDLISTCFDLNAEHSVENYLCTQEIFTHYDDETIVRTMGEQINERGGFQALQANFYILFKVLKHVLNENPEREPE